MKIKEFECLHDFYGDSELVLKCIGHTEIQ